MVHGEQRAPLITNPPEAYLHLRNVLHLNNYQELPFEYDDYKEEYAYIAYEIPPTEDSKASLGVAAEYSVLNRKIQTFHIGFFQQGMNFGYLLMP